MSLNESGMRGPEAGDPSDMGGYPLLARLGAGGMGQVYLSRTPSGRPLALKTVRAEFGLDPGFEERFAREIASSDRVRSAWTVAVVDFSPPGHRPQWLATEYVPAPALSEWVRRHGALPERAVRALAAELGEGLRAVHRAGLAHRDVKPSNVLLARRHPLLIDFGIARAADATRHTSTGGVIGSPGYMAPEQAGGGVSGAAGDVFSLAAVLVYAACGTGPFLRPGEEPSAAQLLYRVVHTEPVLDGVPESLVPLLAACLDKSPGARPTADEVVEELGGGGGWGAALIPGLEGDIAAREAEAGALSEGAGTLRLPGAPVGFGGTAPGTAYGSSGAYRPPVTGPEPPAGGAPRRRAVPFLVAGGIVTAAAVTALLWPGGGGGAPNGDGRTSPPSSPSPSPSLPASWAGTWKGTAPGSTAGDNVLEAHTTGTTVTLTLHAAVRGDIAGRQVSHVTDARTGEDIGCTETLALREVHGRTMVFESVTSTATDPSASVLCLRGNVYTLTESRTDTLSVKEDGFGTSGDPTSLTRSR
ncbi:serine/threonine-protein kinase [Streptomyces sp. NPDC004539]|uniref:serine/threonine protein kinase n=1 Tax=Streptomyces sp. NPDC004539 TaxID=3154280 RepID=UPI0033AEF3A5